MSTPHFHGSSSMNSSEIFTFFPKQEQRMNVSQEPLRNFLTRLAQRRNNSLGPRKDISDAEACSSGTSTPPQMIRKTGQSEPELCNGLDTPAAARVSRELNVSERPDNIISGKRKSPDHEPRLVEYEHPGKKPRRHLHEDPVMINGFPTAQPVGGTGQDVQKRMSGRDSDYSVAISPQQSAIGTGAGTTGPPMRGTGHSRNTFMPPKAAQQSGKADSGGADDVLKTPRINSASGSGNTREVNVTEVRGRDDRRRPRAIALAAMNNTASSSSKTAVKTADVKTGLNGKNTAAEDEEHPQPRQPPLVFVAKSNPKLKLTIPRKSDVFTILKSGKPRAPIDIDMHRGRVRKTRDALRTKQLCNLGAMKMDELLELMYMFYDEVEMSRYKSEYKLLSGLIIYFIPPETGLVYSGAQKKIQTLIERGATVIPKFDPERVTHIITSWTPLFSVFSRTGMRSLDEIPGHIPVVTWKWVESTFERKASAPLHEYASFSEHVVYDAGYVPPPEKEPSPGPSSTPSSKPSAGPSAQPPEIKHTSKPATPKKLVRAARKSCSGDKDSDDSNDSGDEKISDWAELDDHHRKAEQRVLPGVRDGAVDPLAEFYDQARSERDIEYLKGQSGESTGTGDEEGIGGSREPHAGGVATTKGVFQCDMKPTMRSPYNCPNQDVIDRLTVLKSVHEARNTQDDKWRVYAYGKALGPIRNYKKRIESEEEARSIPGVGEKTAKKIMEIIKTGGLQRLAYENTKDVRTVISFQGIYGVGQATAYQWYMNGCRSLDDIRAKKFGVKLSAAQEIGLKYYDDINSRIPRDEVKEIFGIIKTLALRIDPHLFVEVMGSYRRGKETCGDIDILITRPNDDGKTHAGVLRKLIDTLHARRVITEHLCLPEDWNDLELVYRGLCRRSGIDKHRRIDFLTVPYSSRGAALLYYTGDDIFNRSMRLKANKMGYSLNQRGLYKDVIRDPSDRRKKLNDGTILASETEKEIFDILGVPWQEPHERIRN